LFLIEGGYTHAKETRLSQRIVDDVLTEMLAAITQSLRDGESVVLSGFGTFYTKERQPSTVRHIRTGEMIAIPALRQADFRVGELLRRAVRKAPRQRSRRSTERTDGELPA
jgi:DNA-binding protein HU-beta